MADAARRRVRGVIWLLASATIATGVDAAAVPDDMGTTVTVKSPPLRIVSLAPGATEMLFAAGAGEQIVATVDFSDEPPAAKRIQRIGDVTAIDMEKLVALHPDVVVVWPGGGNPAQIEKITRLAIPVYRQQVDRLADLSASLHRLGALAGTAAMADRAARELDAHLARLAREYGGQPEAQSAVQAVGRAGTQRAGQSASGAPVGSPTVLLEVWNRPIYTVGGRQLISDALHVCGARNVFADLPERSPVIDVEAVIARDPDIIVATPPPGEGETWLSEWKRYGSLKAVRNGRLIAIDDPRLIRLGPSIVDATEALCRQLKPK